jgi:drug/metabolite transporter (DMT)-like permease
MAARSAIGLGLVAGFAALTGRLHQIGRRRVPGHALRNLVHFTGQNLWIWALMVAPLAQVIALEFTAPLWVMLLAPFLLGERLTRTRLLVGALGFAGVLVIAQPQGGGLSLGLMAAAASALCFGLTNILTKRLTTDETVLSILFWLTLMQLVMALVLAGRDGQIRWPDAASGPWLAVIGVCGIGAHLSLTNALRLAPASLVMPVDFLRLPIIALIGAQLYAEPLQANVAIGALIILVGNWLNLRRAAPAANTGQQGHKR